MSTRSRGRAALVAVVLSLVSAAGAGAKPILMPTIGKEIQLQLGALSRHGYAIRGGALTPPAPPCPENGLLYPPPVAGLPLSNCGIAQPVATSLPWPGPMAYFGGAVQTHPREYLILWGWGVRGAFSKQKCAATTIPYVSATSHRSRTARLACDPDGAGRYMVNFLQQMGATAWAATSTQYYQLNPVTGQKQFVSNDRDILAGVWADNGRPGSKDDPKQLAKTNAKNPAGKTNTYWDLAAEAARAAAHFGVRGAALRNANFIIAQAPAFTDPNALSAGYCAFHDYTVSAVPGNYYYNGVQQGIAYTNMPYVLAPAIVGGCGKDAVNAGPKGNLDGFSIVLGHEVEETITDPGSESVVGNILTGAQKYYGGWYDATDPNENGDKCAWVGEPLLGVPAGSKVLPIPGAVGNITGNAGTRFAVQSLWSNTSALGLGYCAGAGTNLPAPLG